MILLFLVEAQATFEQVFGEKFQYYQVKCKPSITHWSNFGQKGVKKFKHNFRKLHNIAFFALKLSALCSKIVQVYI